MIIVLHNICSMLDLVTVCELHCIVILNPVYPKRATTTWTHSSQIAISSIKAPPSQGTPSAFHRRFSATFRSYTPGDVLSELVTAGTQEEVGSERVV